MRATDLLEKQHREVASLFRKAIKASAPDERRELADRIGRKLALHTAIEEEIFYPAFREEAGTRKADKQVLEAIEEHRVVKLVLEELPRIDAEAESFEAKMTVLKELVEHHVEEEEQEMFPASEKKLGDERLDELGDELAARAAELEQTEPPARPTQAPTRRGNGARAHA